MSWEIAESRQWWYSESFCVHQNNDVKVTSTNNLNITNNDSISQITQLIVTHYLAVVNAVINGTNSDGKFETHVDTFIRPNWDSDSLPYYGVVNTWKRL